MGDIDFTSDLECRVPTSEELSQVSDLASQQLALEAQLADALDKVSAIEKDLLQIKEVRLPDLMATIGLEKFKLSDGTEIEVKTKLFPNVKSGMMKYAYDWLCQNNLGDIVKDEIKISLKRGQTDLAEKILALTEELNVSAEEKMSIHAQTLKATVKEQMAHGVKFPEECFTIFEKRESTIKRK